MPGSITLKGPTVIIKLIRLIINIFNQPFNSRLVNASISFSPVPSRRKQSNLKMIHCTTWRSSVTFLLWVFRLNSLGSSVTFLQVHQRDVGKISYKTSYTSISLCIYGGGRWKCFFALGPPFTLQWPSGGTNATNKCINSHNSIDKSSFHSDC